MRNWPPETLRRHSRARALRGMTDFLKLGQSILHTLIYPALQRAALTRLTHFWPRTTIAPAVIALCASCG